MAIQINNNTNSGGIGFFGVLAILFIGLKLTGFIDWSWWWVLAPIWGPMLVLLFLAGMTALLTIGANYLDRKAREK